MQFTLKKFKLYANTMGIATYTILVKVYQLINMVKRYYKFIQRTYSIITVELFNIGEKMALQMVFKAINNSVGPKGLIFILFVFNTYFKIVKFDILAILILQCTIIIKKAMVKIEKLRVKCKIVDTLNMRNRP